MTAVRQSTAGASGPAAATAASALPVVLHLRSSGGIFGADRVVLDLCTGLGAGQYQVVLAPLVEADGSGEELVAAARELGIAVKPLRLGWSCDPLGPLKLRRLARQTGATLVHTHDYKADLLSVLAGGGWARVSTLHGWVGTSWMLRLKERLDARLVRRFDRVICVSQALANAESKRGLRNSQVIPNGIDLAPYAEAPAADVAALRREFGLEPEARVIGAIGRLSDEKGYDLLLYAASRLISAGYDLRIVLIGDGPMAATLRHLADELKIGDRLLLPGLRNDAARLYPMFDVFCMPSRREGLPLALLEALAAGCAAVTTPVGGIPEVVGAGQMAMVVPTENPEALAVAIGKLLDDPSLSLLLGQAGRARVAEAFSLERMTAAVATLYDDLLGRSADAGDVEAQSPGRRSK